MLESKIKKKQKLLDSFLRNNFLIYHKKRSIFPLNTSVKSNSRNDSSIGKKFDSFTISSSKYKNEKKIKSFSLKKIEVKKQPKQNISLTTKHKKISHINDISISTSHNEIDYTQTKISTETSSKRGGLFFSRLEQEKAKKTLCLNQIRISGLKKNLLKKKKVKSLRNTSLHLRKKKDAVSPAVISEESVFATSKNNSTIKNKSLNHTKTNSNNCKDFSGLDDLDLSLTYSDTTKRKSPLLTVNCEPIHKKENDFKTFCEIIQSQLFGEK